MDRNTADMVFLTPPMPVIAVDFAQSLADWIWVGENFRVSHSIFSINILETGKKPVTILSAQNSIDILDFYFFNDK
jgi:hypothetical protein